MQFGIELDFLALDGEGLRSTVEGARERVGTRARLGANVGVLAVQEDVLLAERGVRISHGRVVEGDVQGVVLGDRAVERQGDRGDVHPVIGRHDDLGGRLARCDGRLEGAVGIRLDLLAVDHDRQRATLVANLGLVVGDGAGDVDGAVVLDGDEALRIASGVSGQLRALEVDVDPRRGAVKDFAGGVVGDDLVGVVTLGPSDHRGEVMVGVDRGVNLVDGHLGDLGRDDTTDRQGLVLAQEGLVLDLEQARGVGGLSVDDGSVEDGVGGRQGRLVEHDDGGRGVEGAVDASDLHVLGLSRVRDGEDGRAGYRLGVGGQHRARAVASGDRAGAGTGVSDLDDDRGGAVSVAADRGGQLRGGDVKDEGHLDCLPAEVRRQTGLHLEGVLTLGGSDEGSLLGVPHLAVPTPVGIAVRGVGRDESELVQQHVLQVAVGTKLADRLAVGVDDGELEFLGGTQ